MSFIDYFREDKSNSASVAKERLRIIVAHERGQRNQPDYLPAMQQEIIEVIKKYVNIDDEEVHVTLDKTDDHSVFELNVILPG